MATSSLIPTHHAAASISLANAHPIASTATASSGSGGDGGATISANDFLTLLVTEMQNQDPTAQTDPNEYINQLVQVNSLEQLIQINQTLTSAVPTTSGSVSGPVQGSATSAHPPASPAAASTQPVSSPPSPQAAALTPTPAPVAAPVTPGNLSVPATSPAALRVGGALGPRVRR